MESTPADAGRQFDPAVVAARVDALLRGLPRPATGLRVAYSGGLDSTVLLHALASRPDRASRPRLRAVHVDHGLQPQSPLWSRRCDEVCAALDVPCRLLSVDARAPRGASPEAWARRQRRAAIADVLAADEVLLSAHHADDQLETVLLQLFRGGGPAGIAGMPSLAPFGRGWQARPLLHYTRASLRDWADAAGLTWMEDPTNLDLRFDRNYLRHEVLPRLKTRWPQAAPIAVQTAELLAETCELANLVAESDLAAVREGLTLPIEALDRLPEPRQRAVLRAWIASCGLPTPPGRALVALQRDLWRAAADRVPCARWQDARVYRYRGRLYAERSRRPPTAEVRHWDAAQGIAVDGGGRLDLCGAVGQGLSRARLPASLELRPRRGGEHFQPAQGPHRRPLRKWLQEQGVLPWLRQELPLVYAGEELVCIGGLGYGAAYAARDGEEAWEITWSDRPVLTEAEARIASPTHPHGRAGGRRLD